jgi:hypothetical protein
MNRAILLAHYDRDGIIDPYVVAAAREYRKHARVLILISTSVRTPPPSLSGILDHFVSRDNVGYDFGSWKAGIALLGSPDAFDEIVCLNDSVYGPLFDLTPTFTDTRTLDADVWGMVLSDMPTPHVQSWFFAMRRNFIRSRLFDTFWRSAGADMPKEELIRNREVGLSVAVRDAQLRLAAIYDARDTPYRRADEVRKHCSAIMPLRTCRYLRKTKSSRAPFNPSELFYDRLWDHGVPFVKRRIFDFNYYGLNLQQVRVDLQTLSPQWSVLIENHRRRLALSAR